jgi:hypothetical protein
MKNQENKNKLSGSHKTMSSVPLAFTDSLTIENLLAPVQAPPTTYAVKELEYLDPTSFTAGASQVVFDLFPVTSKWTLWSEAYLSLPCLIAPQAGTFQDLPYLAMKGSVLSMINGVECVAEGGTTVFKEDKSTFFTANLLALLQKGSDWSITNCTSLQYAKDRSESDVLGGLVDKASIQNPKSSRFTGAPGSADNADRSIFNKGFMERRAMLLGNALKADGSFPASGADFNAGFSCMLNIPLRYISTFFEAFDSPIINSRFTFTFFLNTKDSNSVYKPLCSGSNIAGVAEKSADISVASPPKLWYHRVGFHPSENAVIAEKMLTGFTKLVRYTQTDIFRQSLDVGANGSISPQIITNVINPKRVFAMVYPKDMVNSDAWPSPCATGALGFSSLNIQVNNSPYFSRPQNTLESQWQALKGTMQLGSNLDPVSQLSYADWLRTYRIHCLDISRQSPDDLNKNASVSLTIDGVVPTTVAVDIVYLIQREQLVALKYGVSNLEVIVGRKAIEQQMGAK